MTPALPCVASGSFWHIGSDTSIPALATQDMSAQLTGLNPALYHAGDTLARLSGQIDEAFAEMERWRKLAESDDRDWRIYERREELALDRYVMLMGLQRDLIERLEGAK